MAKFGFDIHGVMDKYPNLLIIMKSLMDCGHDVHVLTGPSIPLAIEHLQAVGAELGVHYNHLFSITDHLIECGYDVQWRDPSNPVFADAPWDSAKAEYCAVHNICMMLDDSPVYGKYFNQGITEYLQVGGRHTRGLCPTTVKELVEVNA
jgi:hypothetical protein